MHENTTSRRNLVASIISNVFNPLTSLVVFFIYYSRNYFSNERGWEVFLPILFILILPIIFWIYWNVKKGNYTNMDVSNRKQRNTLYYFIDVCFLVYLVYNFYVNHALDYLIFFIFLLLVTLQISNFFIKSSMHTAFNVLVAGFFFEENIFWGIGWFMLAMTVGYTRVILKRHSLKEVVVGGLFAALVSINYILFVS